MIYAGKHVLVQKNLYKWVKQGSDLQIWIKKSVYGMETQRLSGK